MLSSNSQSQLPDQLLIVVRERELPVIGMNNALE